MSSVKKSNLNLEVKSMDSTLLITGAFVKNDLCKYFYDIVEGVGAGDSHSVTGKGTVESSMYDRLSKLNVHAAVLDDAFKVAEVEIGKNIYAMNGDELTLKYRVTGFRLKGTINNQTIVLIGTKQVAHGQMNIDTPEVSIDNISGYPYWMELRTAIAKLSEEVVLYKDGNYSLPDGSLKVVPDSNLFTPPSEA